MGIDMLQVVYGNTKNKLVADRLVTALQPLSLEGTLYIGYPVLASAEEPVSIDALLVSRQRGLVAFIFASGVAAGSDGDAWARLKNEQDRVYFALTTHLSRHNLLRKGRKLGFEPNIVTLMPTTPKDATDPGIYVTDDQGLYKILSALPELPIEYEKPLNAALQRVSTIRPPKKRIAIVNSVSKGGILKQLEQEIANLDQWQKGAAIGSPEGPQRIRGIAGSGKTVVLALKAAYLHVQNPDWTIIVTFHTRSLYQQFTDLIRRFTFEHISDEPDWSKLRVMHSWGGGDRDGVYLEMATAVGVTPRDFLYAKSQFGQQNAFSGICRELLTVVDQSEFEPSYDAVLVDEAQDLPEAFFQLVHKFTKHPKRIVWAYDELQNLSDTTTPPPEELFGLDTQGNPRIQLSNVPGQPQQDIILPVCYRNTPWALTLAHALGFGIYRDGGLIQHFDEPGLWEEIGYEVVSGTLLPGNKVTLKRKPEASPAYFSELLNPNDAVTSMVFTEEAEQAEWIAASIEKNLHTDELEPDDILIVLPDALTAKRQSARLMEALSRRGIYSHLAGVTGSRDVIFDKRSVAMANIFRSKGNEAPCVYVVNAQTCFGGYELIKLRNTLFTAITRSRAWVTLCGYGPNMKALAAEIEAVRRRNFTLEFEIPTGSQVEKLRMIHRERTAAERARAEKAQKGLAEFLDAVQRGDLPVEGLPPHLRTELAKLMGSLAADPNDF
jgi:superfamily I DNA and RNA helicase